MGREEHERLEVVDNQGKEKNKKNNEKRVRNKKLSCENAYRRKVRS